MAEGMFENILLQITGAYTEFVNFFPPYIGDFFNFLIIVLLVFFILLFIWKLYKFISKKNIIELDLNKYNTYEHPFFARLIKGFLYIVEYIIILPSLILFWFATFSFFLMVLSPDQEISQIFLISSIIVVVIRMTSYYREELSQELAKLMPFTVLAISVIDPLFFRKTEYINGILMQMSQIPSFFWQIMHYLGFIFFIEVFLRFFDFIFSFSGKD